MVLKIFKSKITFFLLTTLVIFALNLAPLIIDIRHAPAGRTYGLIHNNVQDFYFYQALMNEGANGANLTYDPFTSEPHKSSIIFSYFLFLGKLSKFLNISYAVMYHLVRIIFGVLLLSVVCYLLSVIKVPHPRLTYLFFLFAAPFMHTINDYGKFISVPYMNWWNGVDPIRRAAFLPHHMLGGLFLVITIVFLFKYIHQSNRKYIILMTLLSVLMAYVHTPSLLIMLLILPPTVILQITLRHLGGGRLNLRSHDSREVERSVIGLLGYWVIGLFFMIVMILQTKNGFPWSQYIDWEKSLQFPLDRELIGALGILFPFSLVGIYHALRSKKFENIFMVCWLIVPFLFIPVAPKLNLSNIRLIQGMPYLPLAILAVLGIKTIEGFLHKFSIFQPKADPPRADNFQFIKFKNLLDNWVIGLLVFIFFIFTYPTLQWSLKDQIREYLPIYGNVYLDNRLNSAFDFINKNFPAKTITLSTLYTGNYLPVYTHVISFIGHFGYTYNEKAKEESAQKFFEGKLTVEEAKNLLSDNKITLVFQGPEEKPLYKDYLYPTLLKVVYDKEEVTLYTFIQTIK